MSCLKRWCVVVLVVGSLAGAVRAQEDEQPAGEQPNVKVRVQADKPVRPAPSDKPARRAPVRMVSGTALDGALAKLELADDVKVKVADALKAVRDKAAEQAKALNEKRAELRDKIKAETDPAKRKELAAEAAKLTGPTDVEQYAAAKAAVKDLLGEEQFGQLDGLAKAAAVELAGKAVEGQVAGWAKRGVELSDDQKAKVETAVAQVKENAGKLEPGAIRQAQSQAMKAVWELRKSVLTEEQQAKLAPPKADKPRPESAPKPVPAPQGEGDF